ncbi:hypothetical protein [Pseudomonas aeruginosa]|uniref:hypothetical protein n=1 Tax=Pseudomonas aeruginosa TaxID=287 RepID=UPI00141BC68D|nr:hypothetical protein [Pseudomonas aeruginosa]
MPGAADIVRHHDSDPLENPWVDGQPPSAASNGWRTTTGAKEPLIRAIYARVFAAAGLI